ncbi:hypothetical protein, partial [Xenorhabdus bovienii]|uniref:hypothetical protein n=1 Tax=Xenorhabdus bovienii TaxID=40576 RepID=UPI0023B33EA2
FALLMLLTPCPYAMAADMPAASPGDSAELLARIARVENGLSSRIVIKGRPGQKTPLAERMAYHHVPAVSIALINNHRIEWARAYGTLE